ncbi:MAG: hypothetical protein HY360_10895 [Verrucomicrobia bacterium]|nr:hypothetical protein [Verrucomicrobiota bacterium]
MKGSPKKKKRRDVLLAVMVLAIIGLIFGPQFKILFDMIASQFSKWRRQPSVEDRVRQYSDIVERRLSPHFLKAGVSYPPKSLVFIGLKQERILEVRASSDGNRFQWIRSYPILAASGVLGPKLREGDLQVPEGVYRIQLLNPNSLYHLSLRVNYPNEFDRARAKEDGRLDLGGDIMIHGSSVSVGCLAMGDEASEDLFVLAALTGIRNVKVILSPVDFRVRNLPPNSMLGRPPWVSSLYSAIRSEIGAFADDKSAAPPSKAIRPKLKK